jgi:hypothetical protein
METALMSASLSGQVEAASFLCSRGANVNAQNEASCRAHLHVGQGTAMFHPRTSYACSFACFAAVRSIGTALCSYCW